MKRVVSILLFLALACPVISAWGRLGHATVAQVAQNHLTPKAEKALHKYLDGLNIVAIASDADTYRGQWTMDLGFVPSNPDEARVPWLKSFDFSTPMNIAPYSHMITVDEGFNCFETDNLNGEYINNIAFYTDRLARELKENISEMSPADIYRSIALIVHFVGDMHCPVHIVYRPENNLKGKFKVNWMGEKHSLHSVWDNLILRSMGNWSYSDMASLVDTASKSDVRAATAGNIYDFASDSAKSCWPVVSGFKEGSDLPATYATDVRDLLFSQLRNGGYRLASILNEIFN